MLLRVGSDQSATLALALLLELRALALELRNVVQQHPLPPLQLANFLDGRFQNVCEWSIAMDGLGCMQKKEIKCH